MSPSIPRLAEQLLGIPLRDTPKGCLQVFSHDFFYHAGVTLHQPRANGKIYWDKSCQGVSEVTAAPDAQAVEFRVCRERTL